MVIKAYRALIDVRLNFLHRGGEQQPMLTIERILTGQKNEEASKKEMTIQKLTDWMEMRRKSIVSVSALKFN